MNTPFRKPRPAGTRLPKATVFRALRSKLGGRPLPAAGGQPRRCTGARPNPFFAVGSKNFLDLNSLERTLDCRGKLFQVVSKGLSTNTLKRKGPGAFAAPSPLARPAYLSSDLAPASSSFFLAASASALAMPSLT